MYEIEKAERAVERLAAVIPLTSYMALKADADGSVVLFWSLMW